MTNALLNDTIGVMANTSHNDTKLTVGTLIVLDDYSTSEKIVDTILTVILCAFGALAVVSMNSTRTTPKTARFLSSALIIFDEWAGVFYTIRKFVVDINVNVCIQTIGVAGSLLAYTTVGMMSLERLLIFCSSNFYLKHMTPKRIRKIAFTVWAIVLFLYIFVRYGLCFVMFENATMLDVIGRCNRASFIYYGLILVSTIIISFMCYFKIIAILKHQTKTDSDFTALKSVSFYRSTSLVFAYIVSVTAVTIGYAFIISLNLSTKPLRISNDIINMVQCVLDPCMYIMWYRETRMEMLKILSKLHPCFSRGVEDMRMEIFNIVKSDSKLHHFHNKVHPIEENTVDIRIVL